MTRANFVIGVALIITGVVRPAAQTAQGSAQPKGTSSRVLPSSKHALSPTIHGNALNAANSALPNTLVRLRDVRLGGIVDTQTTDSAGFFTFTTLDPGSYVVEVIATDQTTVLAASDIVSVNAGEIATAVVKVPVPLP